MEEDENAIVRGSRIITWEAHTATARLGSGTMFGHPWFGRRISRVALLCLLLALAIQTTTGLKVEIDKDGKECFTEHAPNAGDTFSGSFMRIFGDDTRSRGNKWDGAFDLNVRDPKRQIVYTQRHANEHRFEFNAETAGSHEFCFTNLKKVPVVLFYNALVGHHYAHDAATSSHLSELEKALQSLRQVSGEVRVEVSYQKQREGTCCVSQIKRRLFCRLSRVITVYYIHHT